MSVWFFWSTVFMSDAYYKYPRLYLKSSLRKDDVVSLDKSVLHYLRNVLRRKEGDGVRVFNGQDGEWIGSILTLSKKDATVRIESVHKEQPSDKKQILLFFAPIKKARLAIMVEKAVEIGVSGFYPVLTARTENRKLNLDRMESQIVEASEQCERMDVPALHQPQSFDAIVRAGFDGVLYVCLERDNEQFPLISSVDFHEKAAFLIGPEGGFSDEEVELILNAPNVEPISLGENILRAETAALVCLAHACL